MSEVSAEVAEVQVGPAAIKERNRRLRRGVTSAVLVRGVSALVVFFSLPLTLHYLGTEQYGVWVTVATTVAWINILDLGIASTLTNEIARAFTFDDKALAREQFGNALVLSVAIALAAGSVGAFCCYAIPWADVLGVHGLVARNEVKGTLFAAMLLVLLGLPGNLFGRVLAGYQEVGRNNKFVGAGVLLSLIGLLTGIRLHMPMPWLLLVSVGIPTWISLGGIVWLVTMHKPWLMPRFGEVHVRKMTGVLGKGSAFLMVNIAAMLAFDTDNILISHFLGASQVTPYAITWRLANYAGVLQNLLFPSLWPAYSEAFHRRDAAWLKKSVSWSLSLSLALGSAMLFTLIFFGKTIIRHWAGAAAVPPQSLILTIGLWNVFSGAMTAQAHFLGAIGRNKLQGMLSLFAAFVNLSISIWLVQRLGAIGVVIGTIASYLLVLIVPQSILVLRALREVSTPLPVVEQEQLIP